VRGIPRSVMCPGLTKWEQDVDTNGNSASRAGWCRGVFAGGDGAFHEALPVGKVLAGKIGSEEGFFEDGHEGEPLSAAVDGVGTLGVGVVAPVVVGVF